MTFNSLQFVLFLPTVAALYFFTPRRDRWALLLLASVLFYIAFIPLYIFVLASTILVDYFSALIIERSGGKRRKLFLLVSISSTLFILFFFKYFDFFAASVNRLAPLIHWNYTLSLLHLIVPLGLSFHTLQGLSYIIEVYKGNQRAERHFGIYALYVMFFPQLVAGPIERPQHMLPQLHAPREFDYENTVGGLKLILWGMLKKIVIADSLPPYIDHLFASPHSYVGPIWIVSTVLFGIQIYCDFSAYSEIAMGSAKLLGINLVQNFNKPYLAESISDFWRRWHISFSEWLRDYVYIPLGGNRVPLSRWTVNIVITFLASGLWHGANWTFIAWGLLHGTFLIISAVTAGARRNMAHAFRLDTFPSLHRALRKLITFSLVTFTWIFFRAASLRDALYITTHLLAGGWGKLGEILVRNPAVVMIGEMFAHVLTGEIVVFTVLGLILFAYKSQEKGGVLRVLLYSNSLPVRWLTYSVLLWIIIFFGLREETHTFIYSAF